MFLEGLLGAIGGGAENVADEFDNKRKHDRSLELFGIKSGAKNPMQKFKQDVIKGIILQSLKPKSSGLFDLSALTEGGADLSSLFGDNADDDSDLVAFSNMLKSGFKKRPPTAGPPKPKAPSIFTPQGVRPPASGGVKITIK